jgi:hypothetical protein
MKTACLLHSLLKETQEWLAVIGPFQPSRHLQLPRTDNPDEAKEGKTAG